MGNLNFLIYLTNIFKNTFWYCLYVHLIQLLFLLTASATPSGLDSTALVNSVGTESGGSIVGEEGEEEEEEEMSRRRTAPSGSVVVQPVGT